MRSAGLVLAVLVSPAGAQVPAGGRGHGAHSSPVINEMGCALCHRSHPKAPAGATCGTAASFLLVLGEDAQAAGSATCAAGMTRISSSCLRCHSTPDVRARDPALATVAQAPGLEQTFLGSLSDDHPLARLVDEAAARSSTTPVVLTMRGAVPRPFFSQSTSSALPDCTTCHGVHSGPDPVLDPESERGICVSCHEAGRYAQGHPALACKDCHDMHGGKELALLREPSADLLCRSCHESNGPTRMQWPDAPTIPQSPQHALGPASTATSCTDCHAPH